MRSPTIVPFLARGAIVALLVIIAGGLLSGPAGLPPGEPGAEAALLSQVKKLLSSDAQISFGENVAVSGDTAIVGDRDISPSGERGVGAAYIFQRNEGGPDNWGEVKKLTGTLASNLFFGSSVALNGDTAIVGAPVEHAAYVFQRNKGGANNWGEVKMLTASDGRDELGRHVAVSGDTAIVGAPLEDGVFSGNSGAAYVFQRDQGGADNWGEVKKLTASDARGQDFFGVVALSGDTAVVGTEMAEGAYVFERNEGGPGNWGEVKKLTASDAGAEVAFGRNVAVSGDTVVVGALAEDAGASTAPARPTSSSVTRVVRATGAR